MVMPEPFVTIAVPKTMSHKGSAFDAKSLAYDFLRFVGRPPVAWESIILDGGPDLCELW